MQLLYAVEYGKPLGLLVDASNFQNRGRNCLLVYHNGQMMDLRNLQHLRVVSWLQVNRRGQLVKLKFLLSYGAYAKITSHLALRLYFLFQPIAFLSRRRLLLVVPGCWDGREHLNKMIFHLSVAELSESGGRLSYRGCVSEETVVKRPELMCDLVIDCVNARYVLC